ncbi:MAG: NAD-dependent epimerase/dehydratase family protein [Nanoarchaeota archaeon]|nr:NAD-dependent epimerase/dehydratase family protein [Nanoarchaeota archaeon]
MKILVTGGAGFIGHYVVEQLLDKGHHVIIVDDLSKKESRQIEGVDFIKADLSKDSTKLFSGVDTCINLASKIGGIGYFHKIPATILSENCKIYSSTFEAAARCKIRRMVFLSSSMVFESAKTFPSKEEDILTCPPPVTGYGFSKLVGEHYCRTFLSEYGLPYTIIRPFNAYGINEYPGEYVGYAHVIPDLIKKIYDRQSPIEILGDGNQTRCFTHVRDVARAIVLATESGAAENQDFNIGTEEETRIIDLARMLWKICGEKGEFQPKFIKGFEHDIRRRVPDSSKARKLLGWAPEIGLEHGLMEVAMFLKNAHQHNRDR